MPGTRPMLTRFYSRWPIRTDSRRRATRWPCPAWPPTACPGVAPASGWTSSCRPRSPTPASSSPAPTPTLRASATAPSPATRNRGASPTSKSLAFPLRHRRDSLSSSQRQCVDHRTTYFLF
ncbi:uncharacterized protein ACA1_224050 [Acanthamoeba castellanii str. Neff]|uniref:Uncharacterized protein n=1 Tax=Acanthamoeba castellanii (strain ATCC 30010 / Neff) TaxID=1257118 RepID=L8GSZ3_ACACF|nr:uncharacterized protein ACA1_224050 [Acanthamoeba castellanii str. Neff]ELR16047.1 hypothetical protein ACA1_224050 [Acanthamoeba castellanii str. Neff]